VRPDGVSVKYAYDALGRRVSKKVGEAETRWVWDRDVMLHELAGGSTVTWCYEPDTFTPLARVDGGAVHHVVRDQLGAPIAMYQGTNLTWQFQADSFGGATAEGTASTLCPFRWPGQTEDSDTGLRYNRFRYYDPKVGQYISRDCLLPVSGTEPYCYAADPLVWADPNGLVVVYHYTDLKGYNAIRAGRGQSSGNWWWFKASQPRAEHHPKAVYLTPLEPGTRNLAARMQVSRAKTAYWFKMDIPEESLRRLDNSRGNHVWYVTHDLDVAPSQQIATSCSK
jgi:RHS repeat-associated protein